MRTQSALALCLVLLVITTACRPQHTTEDPSASEVQIRDARVQVEIVDTPKTQQRGLGYRDELPWNHGMLFLFERPKSANIWMKGMRFDIDIIWIRDGRIVDMRWRAPHQPQGPLPTYRPKEIADRVLEVPAGYAEAHGWRVGDEVRFSLDRQVP